MKKLKKINLHQAANIMSDEEMKWIVGGDTNSNGCPSGNSETECVGSCTIEVLYEGKTSLISGTCHYSGIGSICACVSDV